MKSKLAKQKKSVAAPRVDVDDKLKKLMHLKDKNKDLKSKLAKQKAIVQTAGVSINRSSKSRDIPKVVNTTNIAKYKSRVEQYKNKELSSYFEKKLRTHINEPIVDIYTVGIRKMKVVLKNIYNITK